LGVFLKGHQALEAARTIDTVVLDKTGTLTEGRMSVAEVYAVPGVGRDRLLSAAGAVEDASEHAIAAAISSYAQRDVSLPPVSDFAALPGLGATGAVAGTTVLVGSRRLLHERNHVLPAELTRWCERWERRGCTIVLVALDAAVVGGFALSDAVKPSAAAAVHELHALGLSTVLLTGDNRATADTVGQYLGIGQVIAEVLPADKAAVIENLQAEGRVVAMVGDGVNDAPALARADLGLALVAGSDVALGAADLILVRDDLRVVPCAVRLARATLRTIRGNLAWAFGYNVAAIPLAAAGLLNPLVAGATMAMSSLFVVSNSLRLNRFDRHRSGWGEAWNAGRDGVLAGDAPAQGGGGVPALR
jgi:cation-transporting P-type ATPase A/B/Cu+-exporting ATPase